MCLHERDSHVHVNNFLTIWVEQHFALMQSATTPDPRTTNNCIKYGIAEYSPFSIIPCIIKNLTLWVIMSMYKTCLTLQWARSFKIITTCANNWLMVTKPTCRKWNKMAALYNGLSTVISGVYTSSGSNTFFNYSQVSLSSHPWTIINFKLSKQWNDQKYIS